MKKLLLVTMVIFSLLLFQGCSKSSDKDEPTKVVNSFLDNVIKGDFEKAYKNVDGEFEPEGSEESQPIVDLLFGKITYEVLDSEIKDDTATVKVKVTHPKMEEIVLALQQSILEAGLNIMSTDENNKKDSEDKIKEVINDIAKNNEFTTVDTEFEFKLKQVDNKWIIDKESNLYNIFGIEN
ncbi:MAG: hypothetical protein N4A63_18090 [Vallitalea sp.]|jgi:PBP1b-binding outer membrane lipoprotein LpoB|nr:hypothetical protein [Vallitalea sp.]